MERYAGKSVVKGIAIGRIFFYSRGERKIRREKNGDSAGEISRYEAAKVQAAKELSLLHKKAVKEVGETGAAVFEVHALMLEDKDFDDSVKNIIVSQQVNAEYAVASAGDNFFKMFSEMEDDYFKARAADVKDVSERLLSVLEGRAYTGNLGENPVIVVSSDLAPSETVQMDKSKLLALVTEYGSSNSHTAILARMMNIPALIGIPVKEEWDGKLAAVDGYSGILYVEPGEPILGILRARMEEDARKAVLLKEMKGKKSVSRGGKRVHLYANIGNVSDVMEVLENDAEGIGLFRSEFLYLEKQEYPKEEELFQAYKSVAEMMAGKKVIIRTLDIGADKQAGYFEMEKEENPAMGYRAIRLCLDRPEVFKTQLRAIYRASAFGNISVMYPMIISVDEVKKIKDFVREVKGELKAEGVDYREIEQGIMIETPAAVMISDLLAEEVDFFSIGTNDLTQYTLALDRQNARLDSFYDAHHPAVLRMIEMTVKNGHKGGCWVGICGELGGDLSMTGEFLRMGIDELSVSPSRILAVRKEIRNTDII